MNRSAFRNSIQFPAVLPGRPAALQAATPPNPQTASPARPAWLLPPWPLLVSPTLRFKGVRNVRFLPSAPQREPVRKVEGPVLYTYLSLKERSIEMGAVCL